MRLYLSLILALILSINVSAQKTLTLDEAIKIALHKNTTLQKSQNSLQSNEANLKSAYGDFLPSLNANGSWSWSRSEDKGGLANFGGSVFYLPPTSTDSRTFSASASTNWVLFNGLSNFATVAQNKNDLEAARLQFQRQKQDIVFNTVSTYYNVLNAKQLLKVREDDLAYNQKNLEIITERNQLGAVTLADVYAQQVRVGNAELALIQAQNDLETQQVQLLNYLGLDVLTEVTLADPLENDNSKMMEANTLLNDYTNISAMVDEAMNSRYDYKSAKYSLQSSYERITVANSGYFPTVSNNNSFYMRANKLSEFGDSKTYQVSLSLNLPIFSGWQTESSVQIAKVNAKNNEIALTELERQIKIDLKKTYLDFQASKKGLDVSQKNIQSAQQNRQIEQEKYNLGSGTLVNLLLASSEYTLALQTNINNKFGFYRLKSQLEYYLGILDFKKFE